MCNLLSAPRLILSVCLCVCLCDFLCSMLHEGRRCCGKRRWIEESIKTRRMAKEMKFRRWVFFFQSCSNEYNKKRRRQANENRSSHHAFHGSDSAGLWCEEGLLVGFLWFRSMRPVQTALTGSQLWSRSATIFISSSVSLSHPHRFQTFSSFFLCRTVIRGR